MCLESASNGVVDFRRQVFSTTKGAGFSSPSTSLRSGYHDVSIGKDVPSQCVENINKYNGTSKPHLMR